MQVVTAENFKGHGFYFEPSDTRSAVVAERFYWVTAVL
jgi:hypothetical protein